MIPLRPSLTNRRGAAVCVVVGSVVLSLGGCTARVGGDGRSLSQHNDELRRENAALQKQIEATQEQLALLESDLRVHRDQAGAVIAGTTAPTFAGLEFGRYTGPIDTDGDGLDDELRLYLKPVDQRGRTLVVAGQATVRVLDLTADEPRVLAEKTWAPDEWDGAYRSGFTGDHFTLSLPLPAEAVSSRNQATVVVEVTEGTRGIRHTKQQAFTLHR